MSLTIVSVAFPLATVGRDAVGGAEQVLSHLEEALVLRGHRSIVLACEGSITAGSLIPTPAAAPPFDDAAVAAAHEAQRGALERVLGSTPVDLVHMHGVYFFRSLPPAGIPVLATLHLPPAWYPPEVFRPERPRTYLNCVSVSQRTACPDADAVIATIVNGVPMDDPRVRPSRRRYCFTMGRICEEKGFHLAIEAATLAGVPLLIAGHVYPFQAHVEYFGREIAPRLGPSIRFMGAVQLARKRRLLRGARCLLVPSLVPETSSLVAMEALACGTPVIAMRTGALPEIVEHGTTGFLVDSARDMAAAIRAVDDIDAEACRRAARERFALSRMIDDYLALYGHLTAARAGAE